jgi:hypothetical protein
MWLAASSMKTSRRGSSSFASSMNLRRSAWIRGSDCSTAVRVFFSRERQLQQDAIHRRTADAPARAPVELPRDLLVREIGLLSDDGTHDLVLLGRDPRRVTASAWPPLKRPSLALQALPSTNEMCRRLPLLLGCSPSPPSMTPALTSSSLNLPISVIVFSSGITPASDSFVALTITMTFMALFSWA